MTSRCKPLTRSSAASVLALSLLLAVFMMVPSRAVWGDSSLVECNAHAEDNLFAFDVVAAQKNGGTWTVELLMTLRANISYKTNPNNNWSGCLNAATDSSGYEWGYSSTEPDDWSVLQPGTKARTKVKFTRPTGDVTADSFSLSVCRGFGPAEGPWSYELLTYRLPSVPANCSTTKPSSSLMAPQPPSDRGKDGEEERARLRSRTVHIPASEPWTSTGFILTKGDDVVIRGSGTVATLPGTFSGPNGQPYHCDGSCSFPAGQFGQLIGKIGKDGRLFAIGEKSNLSADVSGELFLGINDCCDWSDNQGAFDVSISAESRR
jgi:hypothetical protein